MSLKLEVGKTYIDRIGKRWTIEKVTDSLSVYWSGTRAWYTDGRLNAVAESLYDLIAEVPAAEPIKDVDIPHRDILDALLQGKTVQHMDDGKWESILYGATGLRFVLNNPHIRFRVKPEPIIKWCGVYKSLDGSPIVCGSYSHREDAFDDAGNGDGGKILRLELDSDTLDVISARTEAP